MKMTIEELKARIWEDLGLDDRSIIFCHFDTDYGNAIGSGLVETEDDLYDNDEWWGFCYDEVPNIPSVAVDECVTYMLGNGETDRASEYDLNYLNDAIHTYGQTFWDMLDEYADILSIVLEKEAPNPAYDVLEDEDDGEDRQTWHGNQNIQRCRRAVRGNSRDGLPKRTRLSHSC